MGDTLVMDLAGPEFCGVCQPGIKARCTSSRLHSQEEIIPHACCGSLEVSGLMYGLAVELFGCRIRGQGENCLWTYWTCLGVLSSSQQLSQLWAEVVRHTGVEVHQSCLKEGEQVSISDSILVRFNG